MRLWKEVEVEFVEKDFFFLFKKMLRFAVVVQLLVIGSTESTPPFEPTIQLGKEI
jgi:hypothetical protein